MTTQAENFMEFEDAIEALLEQHFPNEPTPAKVLALAVALGDIIGARSIANIDFAVGLVHTRIMDAARAQRALADKVRQQTAPTTEAKQ